MDGTYVCARDAAFGFEVRDTKAKRNANFGCGIGNTFGTNRGDGEFEIFVENFVMHRAGGGGSKATFPLYTAMHFESPFPLGNAYP